MAFSFNLADLVVQLTAKGMDGLNAVLGTVRERLEGVSEIAEEAAAAVESIGGAQKGLAATIGAGSGLTDLLKRAGGQAEYLENALAGVMGTGKGLGELFKGTASFAEVLESMSRRGKGFSEVAESARRMIEELEAGRVKALAFDHSQKSELDSLIQRHLDEQGAFSAGMDKKKSMLAELKKLYQDLLQQADPLHGQGAPFDVQRLGFGELAKKAGLPPELLKHIQQLAQELKASANPALEALEVRIRALQSSLGAGGASAQLGKLLDKFKSLQAGATTLRARLLSTFDGIIRGSEAVGLRAGRAFGIAQIGLLGWVYAGMRGTSVGEALSVRFMLLSRQVASVFLPTIIKVVEWVGKAVLWFQRLNGQQQTNIRRWVLSGMAALAVAAVIPKLITGIRTLIVSLYSLAAAETAALSATGIGALLPLLGAAIAAFSGFATFAVASSDKARAALEKLGKAFFRLIEAARPLWEFGIDVMVDGMNQMATALNLVADGANKVADAFEAMGDAIQSVFGDAGTDFLNLFGEMAAKVVTNMALEKMFGLPPGTLDMLRMLGQNQAGGKKQGRQDVMQSGGQFEDVTAAWSRLQSAALKQDMKSPEAETAENTREMLEEQRQTNRRLDRLNPAFGR